MESSPTWIALKWVSRVNFESGGDGEGVVL